MCPLLIRYWIKIKITYTFNLVIKKTKYRSKRWSRQCSSEACSRFLSQSVTSVIETRFFSLYTLAHILQDIPWHASAISVSFCQITCLWPTARLYLCVCVCRLQLISVSDVTCRLEYLTFKFHIMTHLDPFGRVRLSKIYKVKLTYTISKVSKHNVN